MLRVIAQPFREASSSLFSSYKAEGIAFAKPSSMPTLARCLP